MGTDLENVSSTLIGRLRRALGAHFGAAVYRNAYALLISNAISSGLGFVFWAVAARTSPVSEVGINSALVSAMVLIANVAQLNMRSAYHRFLPTVGSSAVLRFVLTSYATTFGVAILASIAFVAFAGVWARQLVPVFDAGWAPVFVIGAAVWTVFALQDHVLTGLRRTLWVPAENFAFSILKLSALLTLGGLSTYAIFASWVVAAAVPVVILTGWLILKRPAGNDVPVAVSWSEIARFLLPDYAAGLLSSAATTALPLLVLWQLGEEATGYYYIVALAASAISLIATAAAASLMVEIAGGHMEWRAQAAPVMARVALLLFVAVAIAVIGADVVLGVFGKTYATNGSELLRLMAIASIPQAVNTFALTRLRLDGRMKHVIGIQGALAIGTFGGTVLALPVVGLTAVGWSSLATQTAVAAATGMRVVKRSISR